MINKEVVDNFSSIAKSSIENDIKEYINKARTEEREEIEKLVRDSKRNYPFANETEDWRRGYTEALDDLLQEISDKDY